MAVTINASTSNGLIQTADTSGSLSLQANGTTISSITSTGEAVTGNISATGTVADGTATIRPLVSGTAVTASGSSITFSSIPSWVKRVTFIYSSLVSTTGSTVIQLGTSGGLATSGYLGASMNENTSNNSVSNISTGFSLQNAGTSHGIVTFVNITGNTWVGSGTIGWSNSALIGYLSGTIALSGTLTQLALVGTFTSGSVNILYE